MVLICYENKYFHKGIRISLYVWKNSFTKYDQDPGKLSLLINYWFNIDNINILFPFSWLKYEKENNLILLETLANIQGVSKFMAKTPTEDKTQLEK